MTARVEVKLGLSVAEYRAVSAIANRRQINAHTLIEQLVAHALQTSSDTRKKPGPKPKGGGRPRLPVDMDQLRAMHADGATDAAIAAAFDVDQKTIRRRCAEVGLPANATRGRPKTKSQREPTKENHHS